MRYAGQNYERDVPVPAGPITGDTFAVLLDRFHDSHRRFYGHHFPDETIEIIHFNVTALGHGARLALQELEPGAAPAPRAMRRVCLGNRRARIECPIYRRSDLRAGCTIDGPAVIEEPDSTIFLLPDHRLSVTAEGICRITAPENSATTGSGSIGPGAESAPVDAITMSVIDYRLVNVTREMGTAMMRTAYSPIFSESKDLSCAVFDAQGEMIAQGEFCPAQLGAIPHAVRWTIEELGLDSFAPGDVVVHNDPYRGGCHMPEHLMLKPVFDGERLVMFVAVIGHVAEIGAKVVGSFASDATEVFQEGLRLPPVKLMRAGEYVREVWRIILANHRTPRNTWGDFHAMLGALNVGERRCRELLQRYGTRRVLRATQQLIAYSERLMRAELRGIADGEYTAQEQMEDDGISDRPYTIRATVVVQDGRPPGRLHGHRRPGTGSHQRHLRRHRIRHLQRRPATRRQPHPAQLRMLPAPGDHRATRLRGERALPRPIGRRQHRGPAAHRRRHPARAEPGRARAGHGFRGRHVVQLPVRRRPSAHRLRLRALPLRSERLGRALAYRRQQRPEPHSRQLPQYAGRDLRDHVPLRGAALRPQSRLRRPGSPAWRPGHPARVPGSRRRRSPSA